jgi:hypothetical protein
MHAVTRTALLLIVLTFATVCFGQAQDPVALTDYPAPAWPANGVVPAEMKDKYVFIDLAKNQYVVAYPENLGSATFEKDGPGPLKTGRFELLRNVAPAVSLTVTPSGGKFKYAYSLANASAAKQSLDQWSLVVPEKAAPVMKGPEGWFAVHQGARKFKVKDPNWIKVGGAAVWSFRKPEAVINPGDAKGGFELESDLRPGFTIGYFRKAESVEASVAAAGASYPNPVRDQVNEVLAVEYNSKTVQSGAAASSLKLPAARTPGETSVLSALKASLKISS